MSVPHDVGRIRSNLADAIRKSRREALIYAVCTVIFTPIAAAITLAGLVVGMMSFMPRRRGRAYTYDFEPAIATGGIILMSVLFASLLASRPRHRPTIHDVLWLLLSAVPLAVIVWLTYGTELKTTSPTEFWIMYGAFALLMLALMGHAYEPRDDYYLGWGGYYNDPFTLRDNLDRAHVALGCFASLPTLIFRSYAEIFGSLWLFRGLDEAEEATAAAILFALGQGQTRHAAELLRGLRPKSAARVLRALDKLELLRIGKDGLALSSEGERLVGLNPYL